MVASWWVVHRPLGPARAGVVRARSRTTPPQLGLIVARRRRQAEAPPGLAGDGRLTLPILPPPGPLLVGALLLTDLLFELVELALHGLPAILLGPPAPALGLAPVPGALGAVVRPP